MMILLLILFGFFPSGIQKVLRRIFGAEFGPGSKVSMFSFVLTRNLKMGRNARIRPFSIFKVRQLSLGENTIVDPFVLVNCDNGPRSHLTVGKWCRIFSFSILEPSEGITLKDHVGLGGQCLIFCHGSWPNYLNGAPYDRGAVTIESEVWIPWRVMILPNSHIESRAIVGAHSLVRGHIKANSMVSGVPAILVKENAWQFVSEQTKRKRFEEITTAFLKFHDQKIKLNFEESPSPTNHSGETVLFSFNENPSSNANKNTMVLDLANLKAKGGGKAGRSFLDFALTFGVRIDHIR